MNLINTFPSYLRRFSCIAENCGDTCCAGWEIVVDSESVQKYSALSGEFAEKVKSSMVCDEDGDIIFAPVHSACPFLLENGLCEMYIKLGEASLCRTCRLFPRHVTSFGARLETGLSLSCPEAARIIFESDEPIDFQTEAIDGELTPCSFDPDLYFTIISARKRAIDILENREFSFFRRLIDFLDFTQIVDTHIRKRDFAAAHSAIDAPPCSRTFQHDAKRAEKAKNRIFADLLSLEFLDPCRADFLRRASEIDGNSLSAFKNEAVKFEWAYEKTAVYFVFRYFSAAVFDGDLLTKAKFAAVSIAAIIRLQAALLAESGAMPGKTARTQIIQKHSKETEHSAQNMALLFSSIKKSRLYSTDSLINIFSEQENSL